MFFIDTQGKECKDILCALISRTLNAWSYQLYSRSSRSFVVSSRFERYIKSTKGILSKCN